jgi:hypothetical protein
MLVSIGLTAVLLTSAVTATPDRLVTFSHPDGPYTPEMHRADFGSNPPNPLRGFGEIVDGAIRVGFNAGKKVSDTGYSAHIPVEPAQQYTLSYRIRFPESFEAGLHGKQSGMSGGKGYDGGRGQQARDNGDGWSIRLQFDANEQAVTNTLYVYSCTMPGTYGQSLGAKKFPMERERWYRITLTTAMQSAPDAADGRIQVWRDDELMIDIPNVQFVHTEEGRRIDRIRFETFPGGGGVFPSHDTYIEYDDFQWGRP